VAAVRAGIASVALKVSAAEGRDAAIGLAADILLLDDRERRTDGGCR
jgi:hypothetical protein